MRVDIFVDFLFHVADSVRFVHGIAPENMEELLRATQAETVRSLVRSVRMDQVLDLRGMNSEDMVVSLNEKMQPYGILIDQVTIARVALPQDVALSLQRTTAYEARQGLLAKQHMFEERRRDYEQALLTAQQARKNERERAEKEAQRAREETRRAISAIEVERDNTIATLNADRDSRLAQMDEECAAACGAIDRERRRLVQQILEDGRARQQRIVLESAAECRRIRAETAQRVAEIDAQVLAARADAERRAAQSLAAARLHEERLARLRAIIALAQNPRIVISGDSGSNPLAALTAATRAQHSSALQKSLDP